MASRHPHPMVDLPPEVLSPVGGSDEREIAALEAEASSGCSVCARVLVNARETTVDLALVAGADPPSSRLRERVLASARERGLGGARHEHDEEERVTDPAGAVAHLHIGKEGDAARTAEVDALDAYRPREGDGCHRILAQVERTLRFRVFFVSVVRGERVGYRAQRGLPPELEGMTEMRREMTFCTHCADADEPLVVENAASEPFFRRSKMVVRYGVGAYAGVPLRTSRGVTIGTLCALDVSARRIPDLEVRVLETFAEAVVAEIERARTPALRESLLEHAAPGSEVYRRDWFRRVCALELDRAAHGHQTALLHVVGTTVDRLGAAAQLSEVAGRLDEQAFGIVLANAPADLVQRRAREVAAELPGARVTARPTTATLGLDEWIGAG